MTQAIENAPVTNVVSNDTAAVPSNSAQMKTPIQVLERMESERKAWESGAYKTSNQELYSILAECLAYGGDMETRDAKKRSEILEKFHVSRGYHYKKDSPLMTRIVRAVFGDIDRRRLSTYSLVLREAQRQQVFPTNLANWIESKGGIQEIRLTQSASYMSQSDKVSAVKTVLGNCKTLAVVKTPELEALVKADFIGEAAVLLSEQQADGSFVVKALLRSSTAVNAALAALYTLNAATAAEKKDESKAAANESALQEAIANAAATARLTA